MIEEGFLFRSIVWDIAVTSLRVIRVTRVIPAYRWTRVSIRCGVRAWSLNPTLWHIMVAKFCEDGIVSNTRVLWITVCTLFCRYTRCAAYSMPLSASESDSYAQHNPADQPLRMSRYAHRRY